LHLGLTTHIWNIDIQGNQKKLISVSRLTTAILKRPGKT